VTEVPEEDSGWVHEMKLDGYRIQAHLKNGIGSFYTRNAHEWSNFFPHLLDALEKLPIDQAIFDGEIVAMDADGRSHFQNLQNSFKQKHDQHFRYYLFDILYVDGTDLRDLPLIERKNILKEILQQAPASLIFSEHLETDGKHFYQVACEHQLEGIISKLADAPYHSGRNDLWVKVKCTSRQEFVIGGWTDPQGGRKGLGALLLGIFENNKLRYAGKVGTGFDQQSLLHIKKELESLEASESPFALNTPAGKNIHWVRPVKVCEASFSNWTEERILRNPVFLGIREDKKPKEIKMERPKHLSLVKEITSPEKILYKTEKITKQDIGEFYQTIAEVMLPYMADRPLSLVRCPEGAQGGCFYQKHISGQVPNALNTFPIKEEKGKGIYLSLDSTEGLLELVQLNAFEIHAWNTHYENYANPDQIVMDLDPGPGVSWKEVIEAAWELKHLLDDLDLKSFVKLTGGKGLHLHVPIAPLYDWDQVKSFAQTLALELVSRNPQRYTANMSKNLRKRKIFIDYLRNGYGATAVVPYSLRAKPRSAVAMPVAWNELRRIQGPQAYSLQKALKKIKTRKEDPWEGMLQLKQEIGILHTTAKGKKSA
jgi:bifunctional non-homologous end joining protein LigD